jgi:uncharacterized membrane protein
MAKKQNSAVTLKNTLLSVLALLVLGTGASFYVASQWLEQSVAEKNSSSSELSAVDIEGSVNTLRPYGQKAEQVYYSSSDFQTQITTDINVYANQYALKVSTVSVESKPSDSSTKLVDVRFTSPVNMSNFIRFLGAIETNLPTIVVSKAEFSTNNFNAQTVDVKSLILEVYTK